MDGFKDIAELISLIPEILQYYFIGYVFLIILEKGTNKIVENEHFHLLSIMISFAITSIIGCFRLQNIYVSITIGLCLSILLSFILIIVYEKLNLRFFHNTSHSIWEDVLDLNKGNILKIHLKDDEAIYLGHLRLIDDDRQWVFLNLYKKITTIEGKEYVEDSRQSDNKPGILIKMDEIKTVEVYYDPNTTNEFCRPD